MTYRIVIADDHPLVRAGLRAVLADEDELQVVGETESGEQLLALCAQLRPDVLLFALNLQGVQPEELVAALRQTCPETKVLILSSQPSTQRLVGLVASGISGYVQKDEAVEIVPQAIRSVMQGGTWWSGPVARMLSQGLRGETPDKEPPVLTERERQLLARFLRGLSNEQISADLHLSRSAIRNYSSRLYRKLGVRSREEAIVWALTHGFGEADQWLE